jgi:D-alanine transaminase
MIYLNGKFMPLNKAMISVLDRGFIFGDGVYEVIPVYSRRPFRLKEHLARLQNSLDGIRLKNPYAQAKWRELIGKLIEKNTGEDQYIYLQITRGAAKRDHAFPKSVPQTVFMMSSPLETPPAVLRKAGVSAVSAQDNRWLRCDLKTTALLANVLLRQLAIDEGAVETILLRDGFLTEGAASNIFVVFDGILLAPPKNNLMLPGITYDVVLELAQAHGLPYQVRDVSEYELRKAQEIWLTSSTKEILPITRLDGRPVGNGKPGRLFHRMHDYYQDYKSKIMRSPAKGRSR